MALRWRQALDEALREVVATGGTERAGAGGSSAPGSGSTNADTGAADTVWVSAHMAAVACPAGFLGPDDGSDGDRFTETPATAARAVALVALGSDGSDGSAMSASDRIRDAIADPTRFRPGLTEWLRSLDRAASATVVAEATSWMQDAIALATRGAEPRWQPPANPVHRFGKPPVKLSAAVDATKTRPDGRVRLLTISLRPGNGDARRARRVALVWALTAGTVPSHVVIGHREPLELDPHPIDDDSMAAALREAVDDVVWTLRPSSAAARRGRDCRFCTRLDDCDDGLQHEALRWRAPFPPGAGQPSAVGDPTM